MAETWIKMRTKLRTDPRVWAIARDLDTSINAVLGGLFQLWCIGDEHGGNLSALDADTLNDMVRIPGFIQALPECWIEVQKDGIELPKYDDHNGSTGKRRAKESKRKADARNTSAPDADKKRTREEKKREEKSKTTTLPESRFDRFWQFFPRKTGKGKAKAAFLKLKAEDQHKAVEQAEAYRQAYEQAPDNRKQYFKHPTTWINGQCWDDDHEEWKMLIEGK